MQHFKKIVILYKKISNIFLAIKSLQGKLVFILKIMKKIAKWRNKSEISKQNVKTMKSPLLFHLWENLGCEKKQYDPLTFILWVWVAAS